MAQNDTIIGLDVGTYSIKVAWVKGIDKAPKVVRTERLHLPLEGAHVRNLIVPWAQKLDLHRFPCVIGLPGAQTMFQPFVLPPGDPRDEEQAAAMEVVKFNEMASEPMIYDLARFSFNPGERRLLLGMARPSQVEAQLEQAGHLGLNVIDVVPGPVALFNAVEAFGGPHEPPQVCVNIGRSTTDVAIGGPMGLMFARSFSSGGQIITDSIVNRCRQPRAKAETFKTTELELSDSSPQAEAARQAAEVWFHELQSCLSVYRTLFGERKIQPEKIVLCGGGASLKGLRDLVAERVEPGVSPLDVFPGLKGETHSPEFATAIGLALSAGKQPAAGLSLLPDHVRDELMFRRQKPYWVASGVVAALILAVSLIGGCRDSKRKEAMLSAQSSSLQRRQLLAGQIENMELATEHLHTMTSPVRGLLSTSPLVRDLITLVSEQKARSDVITMIVDADTYFDTNPLAPTEEQKREAERLGRRAGAKPPTEAAPLCNRLMVAGITPKSDFSTVKQLIAALDEADFVASADLLSDDQVVGNPSRMVRNRPARAFVIDIRLEVP